MYCGRKDAARKTTEVRPQKAKKGGRKMRTRKGITVIGDSVSKGLYLEDRHIRRIEKSAIDILSEDLGVEIENFSQFGQTLKKSWEKGHFERFFDPAMRGSTLVVALGGNDCDYDWPTVAADPFAPHRPHTTPEEFARILRTLASRLRANKVRAAFASLPPINAERYFKNVICARADGESVMKFFCGDLSNIERHQECYNAAVLKAALENGCDFIDFRSPLLLMRDYLDCLSDDGIHPSAEGHRRIAAIVEQHLQLRTRMVVS